jgi:hypothetical protein
MGCDNVANSTTEYAPDAPDAPGTPTVIEADRQLAVSWTAVSGAEAYEVYYGTEDNSSYAEKYGDDINGATETGIFSLTNGTTYYVWIKAKNTAGTSGFSPSASGSPSENETPPLEAPAAPSFLRVTPSFNQITASWDAVGGVTAYEVHYDTSSNPGSATKFGDDIGAAVTEITITPLLDSTSYYVWVKAKNSAGSSGFSPGVSARTSDPIPEVFTDGGNTYWSDEYGIGDGYIIVDLGSYKKADERYEITYEGIGWSDEAVSLVITSGGEGSFGFTGVIKYFLQHSPTAGVILLEYYDDDDCLPLGAWNFSGVPDGGGHFQGMYYYDLKQEGGSFIAEMGQANGYSAGLDNNQETVTLNEAIAKFCPLGSGPLDDGYIYFTLGITHYIRQ